MIRILPFSLFVVLLIGGCAKTRTLAEDFAMVEVKGQTALGDHSYDAYISAPLGTTDPVDASVDLKLCQINLNGGWAYLWGSMPVARGKRVRVVGTGTRFILEIAGPVDRVYFIPESGTHSLTLFQIDAAGVESPVNLTLSEKQYVEIDGSNPTPMAHLIVGSPQENFVKEVQKRVPWHSWPWLWP